jgi:hypothetical protein
MRTLAASLLLILILSNASAFGEEGCKYDTQCR